MSVRAVAGEGQGSGWQRGARSNGPSPACVASNIICAHRDSPVHPPCLFRGQGPRPGQSNGMLQTANRIHSC